jgi:hypothetical protein
MSYGEVVPVDTAVLLDDLNPWRSPGFSKG